MNSINTDIMNMDKKVISSIESTAYLLKFISIAIIISIIALITIGLIKLPNNITSTILIALALIGFLSIILVLRHLKIKLMSRMQDGIFLSACFTDLKRIRSVTADLDILDKYHSFHHRVNDQNVKDFEIEQVLCRQHFRDIVKLWNTADSIATFHALQSISDLTSFWSDKDNDSILLPIQESFIINENIRNLIIKVRFHEIDDEQGSCWYANDSTEKKPSLEAAYAAIRLAENLLKRKGEKLSFENFQKILGNSRLEMFLTFLKKRFSKATGGFNDFTNSGDSGKSNIASTGLAIRIFSTLFCKGKPEENIDIEDKMSDYFNMNENRPSDFILNCRKTKTIEGQEVLAFSETIESKKLWLCISFFAASSLFHLNNMDLLEKTDKKYKEKIENFLELCLKPENKSHGYVASTAYIYPDLMHTYYALRLAELVCPRYLKRKKKSYFKKINSFVNSCKADYGYGFRQRMAPNVFSTCLARNTYILVEKYLKGFRFDPYESLYFFTSCFDNNKSAFAGYPLKKQHNDFIK